MGYEILSMDVDNAFLQALLNEDIYISQAEGFQSKEHPDYVCHLIRALYGLKQEPHSQPVPPGSGLKIYTC